MELRLTLKGPERLLAGRTGATLRAGALTIGRAADAGWPIADPERIISKVHCRIEKDFDSFQLTDTSTNGVKVNETPVGYGLACRIQHGDIIKLGDAVVTAEIVPATDSAPPLTTAPTQDPTPATADMEGPFGPFDSESATPGPARVASEEEAIPLAPLPLDDWWGPVAAEPSPAEPKPVDISDPAQVAAIEDIHLPEDSLLSADVSVASLQRMAAGLDLGTFVQAVEDATQVLSVNERNRFRNRLLEIIRNAPMR